jgi:hypothetical protein
MVGFVKNCYTVGRKQASNKKGAIFVRLAFLTAVQQFFTKPTIPLEVFSLNCHKLHQIERFTHFSATQNDLFWVHFTGKCSPSRAPKKPPR